MTKTMQQIRHESEALGYSVDDELLIADTGNEPRRSATIQQVLGALWRPIETAPRGSDAEFLGWDGSAIDKTWEGWEDGGAPVYVRAEWVSWNPTHWMPLPPPPTA